MHIYVITHVVDELAQHGKYMLFPILEALVEAGHKVTVSRGIPNEPVAADLAIMHVDLTIVPPEYLEFGRRYAKCLNSAVEDISKRVVSGALLQPGSDWNGMVMVKGNLNCSGVPELRAGIISKVPNALPMGDVVNRFGIYRSLEDVPPDIANNPDLVVERYMPELGDDGEFACRFWTFSGDQERCARVFSRSPIVKATLQTHFEFCEVPDQLRALRAKLGFDFGKFDFVIHEGEVVLLDANKTPGLPPVSKESKWPMEYAEGLLRLAG